MTPSEIDKDFDNFLDQHKEELLFIIHRKIGFQNREEAEDILQDAFLALLGKLKNSKIKKGRWIYFLVTVCRNKAIDWLRKHRHEGTLDPRSKDENPGPEESVLGKEKMRSIARAIERLSDREKQIVILTYYEELTSKEIGDKLQLNPSRVRNILVTARRRIKQILEENLKTLLQICLLFRPIIGL